MTTRNDRLLRHGLRSWLILYGSWTLPALTVSIGVGAVNVASGGGDSLVNLIRQLTFYYVFATACPAVYRALVHWPFTRRLWPLGLMAQLSIAATTLSGGAILRATVEVWLGDRPGSVLESIRTEFTSQQGVVGMLIGLFYCVVVFGAMLLVRLSRQRKREQTRSAALALRASQLETQVTQAQLKALEMQFNPHFLFNALNSIASLVQQRRSEDAYHAIALLGELLRDSMEAGRRQTIPLHEELGFLERYLAMERLRFSDRLATQVDVAEDCRTAVVPAMLLQPLVENVIRHAVSADTDAVHIDLSVRRRDARLLLEIRDDGPGLPQGWTLEEGAGVGLDTVRRRLAAHHDDDFELQVVDRHPSGVIVRISLPYRTSGERTEGA